MPVTPISTRTLSAQALPPTQPRIPGDWYSDSRTHGYQGPTRHVRFPRAMANGGGAMAKSDDGRRCVVAGKESLRIFRMSEPGATGQNDHKSVTGRGGHRIEVSRNLWDGTGMKMDSATTDVIWGQGLYDNKILTSARNGELIMWDLNKSGPKYDRKIRGHNRSIHALTYSTHLHYYCMTGSADGHIRVWDIRDLTKSVVQMFHPSAVRAVAFSPVPWQPHQAVVALDNGTICRWDLQMGQRGQLDRILVAHSGPILALDWSLAPSSVPGGATSSSHSAPQTTWYSAATGGSGIFDDLLQGPGGATTGGNTGDSSGAGWLASGGLDHCVKVWDLTSPSSRSHISHAPTYTLRTAYPVRRVLWRPDYECELAIVSNADFGTGQDVGLAHAASASGSQPGLRLGVGSGPTTAASSPRIGALNISASETALAKNRRSSSTSRHGSSDPIEIWDVRRGYIAKWMLDRSAVDGGVTDLEFGDSHVIWAQHHSGSFSQLDMRDASRPLDAIPRSALSWDATGCLAFAADRPKRWEIPYDDIKPEKRQKLQDSQAKEKALGDPSYFPATQSLGTFTHDGARDELESFVKLAHGYVYEGMDKLAICENNSEMAFSVGHHDAAQMWIMLKALLVDIIPGAPPTPPLSPLPDLVNPGLPHSVSAPAAIPTLNTLMSPVPQTARSVSIDAEALLSKKDSSPGSQSKRSIGRPSPSHSRSPLKTTPVSSTASSPRRANASLPPHPAALFARRESNVGHSAMRPRLVTYRRPSFSTPSIHSAHSESPSDSTRSVSGGGSSLRHVDDGALSDSDSEGSDHGSRSVSGGEEGGANEDEVSPHPPISPYLYPRTGMAQPSPLSQVAVQQTWTEDEKEDEDSPSPASTEESSDEEGRCGGGLRRRPSKARRSIARSRTRSRSSTVASLPVAAPRSREEKAQPLKRQDSHSSVQTVTAGNTPVGHTKALYGALQREETVRAVGGATKMESIVSPRHTRARSDALSTELVLDPDREAAAPTSAPDKQSMERDQSAVPKTVRDAERRYRELVWEALRELFEASADEGDVQLCAFMSLVAPKELKVSKARTLRFVEAYIEVLNRLRLHTAAAYMRKFVDADEIRALTSTQTTVYTACSKCRKAIIVPLTALKRAGKPGGSYAFCQTCRTATTVCTVCHLPVRALVLACPVCSHGGHPDCLQKYYRGRPLTQISAPSRASSSPRHSRHPSHVPNQHPPSGLALSLSGGARASASPAPSSATFTAEPRRASPPRKERSASVSGAGERRGRAMSRGASGSLSNPPLVRAASDDGEGGGSRGGEEGSGAGQLSRLVEEESVDERRLWAHPCAAGCGHFCWAADEPFLDGEIGKED
ncbi:WD40 repeat-like protein [Obba rivulosa]|uniref:WD40 repeat-like protein n=1 Tax=Obba rivulosa TaxID=1052685 RepID=A0A8E2DKE6_9APHY|nr:WD40 repeat-like protein [Obba rivulosa]